MVGLGFAEKKKKEKEKEKEKKEKKVKRLGLRGRNESPDSVIFTTDESSNFSLFSSACGSVDRRSFASEFHDHEALVSELSKHLGGRDVHECSSSPDADSNIFAVQKSNCVIRNEEKVEALDEEEEGEEGGEEDYQTLDPPKSSFSQAVRECQYRRHKPEALPAQKKHERQRPLSLDLYNPGNNVNASSPRYRGMRKSSVSSGRLDTFLSPGRPNYWQGNVGIQKGWSSERVPLPANGCRRNMNAGFLPFNHGRALPSKWEDAEKWICSPFGGDGASQSPIPPSHRRPKSKSGPLGQQVVTYHSAYSPSIPTLEGVSVGNYTASSPFSTGVMAPNALPGRGHCSDSSSSGRDGSSGSCGRSYAVHKDSCIVRSVSIHGWSAGVLAQSTLPSSKDEKQDGSKDAVTMKPLAISRRDIATQMSPEGSTHSSPQRMTFFSPSHPTSLLPIVELQSHPSKLEVRDVQVDDRVIVTRWSQKHGPLVLSQKGVTDVKDNKKKVSKTEASAWEVAATTKSKRDEARIIAWENLQKAKAEAAIRKLEMKLEKKRSSSMDKIMNKLRSAQKKAQEMRNSASSGQTHQVARISSKKVISFRKPGQRGSLSGCFTCRAS